jgi:predicted hydrocarbon binding protein
MRRDKYVSVIRELTDFLVGDKVSKLILYRLGNEIGHIACDYSRKVIKSEADLGPVLNNILFVRGWADTEFSSRKRTMEKITFILQATETLSAHERTSVKATCNIENGIASGFLEAYVGKKAQSHSEVACASTGSQHCIFETSFDQ